MKIFNLLTLILFSINVYSQSREIDSLKKIVEKNINDTIKLDILNQLVNISSENEFEKFNISLEKVCLKLKKSKDKRLNYLATTYLANVYDTKGYLYREKGNLDSSFFYCDKSLQMCIELNDLDGITHGYRTLVILLSDKGEVLKALDYFHKGLLIAEKSKDTNMIAGFYSSLSVTHYNLKNNSEALKFIFKSQFFLFKLKNNRSIADNYNTLSNIYSNMGKLDSSIYYSKKGFKLFTAAADTQMILTTLNNIGHTFYRAKQLDSALFYYLESHHFGNNSSYSSQYSTINNNIGEVYLLKNNLPLALKFSEQALFFEKKNERLPVLRNIYRTLERIYYLDKQYKKAYDAFTKFIEIKDTLEGIEVLNGTTRKFLTFEFEKKQLADSIKVVNHKKVANIVLQQEKSQKYVLYGGLALVVVFAGFIFNRFKVTQKQKQVIELKENETQKQNLIITEQKHLVEEKHKEITDSINYAERIQRALLASKKLLDDNLSNYFILFKPKDVVSGDFYWATTLSNGNFILVTADSTGHGVPGAIMSIVNIASLKEAVVQGIQSPDLILNETRRLIIENLKNDGSAEGGKDGMDASLLSFDFKNNVLTCACANNPIWIIRDKTLIEIKPDRMPIGKHDKDKTAFTLQTISLKKGDVIYTLTDGFPDQFGGESGKKFKSKQLQEMLVSIANEPMEIQKQKLSLVFDNWKGDLEQVDDVCVIGIKL